MVILIDLGGCIGARLADKFLEATLPYELSTTGSRLVVPGEDIKAASQGITDMLGIYHVNQQTVTCQPMRELVTA